MKSVELQATLREDVRKKSALNALRNEGRVPAILYGVDENINFHVDNIAFLKLINTPEVYFIDLQFGDKVIKAVIREVQFHPVSDEPIHIDFMAVYEDQAVTIAVPVKFVGNSIGVMNGGKRREKLRKLVLKALPAAVPEQVEVDITKLRIGQTIKVKDIQLEGVEFLDNENAVVIAIKTSRVAVAGDMEDEMDEEEEEGAEAEATTEAAAE